MRLSHLLLGIGPARNLHNHVQHGLLLIGVKWDVVEWRDGDAILLNVDAVLEGVWSTDLAGGVGGWSRHVGGVVGGCC